MRNFTGVFSPVLCSLVVSSVANADPFFSSSQPINWYLDERRAPMLIEAAMDDLEYRIELGRRRIAGAEPKLRETASRLMAIQKKLAQDGHQNAAKFYEQAANAVRNLPSRFHLVTWLEAVELEKVEFCSEVRSLPRSDVSARTRVYDKWKELIGKMSGRKAAFFETQFLESQEAFDSHLLQSALPLCDLGQHNPAGLNLVKFNENASVYVHHLRHNFISNYSFLFASVSPNWPWKGQQESSILLEFAWNAWRFEVQIPHAVAYFNLFHDSDVIAAMLDGKWTGKPLEVSLVDKSWLSRSPSLMPVYSPRRHRLTTYFNNRDEVKRWQPAVEDIECVDVLRHSFTPGSELSPASGAAVIRQMLSELK